MKKKGHRKMDDPQSLADIIIHRVLMLIRSQHRSSTMIKEQVQITGRQVAVLRYLDSNGPSTVTEVARFLYVREATASTMLDRMEQGGYVTRTRSKDDNRKVIINPTPLGHEISIRAPLGTIAKLREKLPKQSEEDLAAISSALDMVLRLCDIDESLLD